MTPSALRLAEGKKEPARLIYGSMAKNQTMTDGCGSLQADSLAKLEQLVSLALKVPVMRRQPRMHPGRKVLEVRYLVELDCLKISSAQGDPSW